MICGPTKARFRYWYARLEGKFQTIWFIAFVLQIERMRNDLITVTQLHDGRIRPRFPNKDSLPVPFRIQETRIQTRGLSRGGLF